MLQRRTNLKTGAKRSTVKKRRWGKKKARGEKEGKSWGATHLLRASRRQVWEKKNRTIFGEGGRDVPARKVSRGNVERNRGGKETSTTRIKQTTLVQVR